MLHKNRYSAVTMAVDGIPLDEAEREAYEEREAICLHDGLVSREEAAQQAVDTVRKMRENKGK